MPASIKKREKTFDPRDTAAYTVAEAARYLKLPTATLPETLVAAGLAVERHDDLFPPDCPDAGKYSLFSAVPPRNRNFPQVFIAE